MILRINSNNEFIFVMETIFVFFVVRNKFLNVTNMSFVLQRVNI
jgi:hypothetical protein